MPTFNVPILLLLQVFVVLEGEVTVVLHTTQFNAKKGDSFYIPPKNYYNLLNQKAREAELSLIQVFQVLDKVLAGNSNSHSKYFSSSTTGPSPPSTHPASRGGTRRPSRRRRVRRRRRRPRGRPKCVMNMT